MLFTDITLTKLAWILDLTSGDNKTSKKNIMKYIQKNLSLKNFTFSNNFNAK